MESLHWWQRAVFYQVYLRSFADGNGDGIGDLAGLIDKLDYLQWLGVDAIWLSPHFPSPQADCGYDVSDYVDVAPEYGTLDTFQQMLAGAHARNIRVILDLVLNHTSEEHPWFEESRSSRDNPKHDWFVWRDPAPDGGPPNDWQSGFGGSAWTYEPQREQYYYHFFLKEQPDLNWHNPAVKEAIWDVVRFWLDLGVDGFRLDAIGTIFEDDGLPNHNLGMTSIDLFLQQMRAVAPGEQYRLRNLYKQMIRYQHDLPAVHDVMVELRAVVDGYEGRVLVGESADVAYYGDGNDELHLLFNFDLMQRDAPLTAEWVAANQLQRRLALPPGAWPCNTFSHHDASRPYTHYGDGAHDAARARLTAALLLTLRGTPFLYNGEEIGMTDLILDDISQIRDTMARIFYHMAIEREGVAPEQAIAEAARFSRDRCRTPMQWTNAPHGGFSPPDATPWLPVNPNFASGVNVAAQRKDEDSLLHFYRTLLHLRRQTPALVEGDYELLHASEQGCLAFWRRTDAQRVLVVLNFSDAPHTLCLEVPPAQTLFSSHDHAVTIDPSSLTVAPFEVLIAEAG